MMSGISTVMPTVNNLLRNQRDPTIAERAAKSCATPIDMWSVDDPSKRVQFMGTCDAQRQVGIDKSNIVKTYQNRQCHARPDKQAAAGESTTSKCSIPHFNPYTQSSGNKSR